MKTRLLPGTEATHRGLHQGAGAIAMGLVLAACGGGEGGGPIWDDTYTGPGDFERAGCDGDIEELEIEGLWHVAAEREDDYRPAWWRPEADVLRFEGRGEELTARVAGLAWDTAERTEEGVVFRYVSARSYQEQVWAMLVCGADGNDTMYGRYADCYFSGLSGEDVAFCEEAGFTAVRVEPREASSDELVELAVYAGPEGAPWNTAERAATAVRAHGQFAYVARAGVGLSILDVSDPSEPSEVGRVSRPDGDRDRPVDVDVLSTDDDRTFAVMASADAIAIVDVTAPAQPEVTAELDRAVAVFVDGDRLYAGPISGLPGTGLAIYDMSDPSEPELLGTYEESFAVGGDQLLDQPPPSEPNLGYDIHAEGDRVYLSYARRGLVVLDVSDPEDPSLVARFSADVPFSRAVFPATSGGRGVILHIDETVGGLLRVLDGDEGSDTYLEPIGAYSTRPQVGASGIAAAGTLAFVAHHQDGLRVLDVAEPDEPIEVAHYATWPGFGPGYGEAFAEGALDVDLDLTRGLVYLADSHLGLVVLQTPSAFR